MRELRESYTRVMRELRESYASAGGDARVQSLALEIVRKYLIVNLVNVLELLIQLSRAEEQLF